ncbi:MAG TPA: adenine phosphoribosyltransferase [Chthoniobacterales bacterium]|nr:adenine phosphoribosyltransferase [Chthoniobacterales bacterium]
MDSLDVLRGAIRDVLDFPKPGIVFKDITPILGDPALFRIAIQHFVQQCAGKQITRVAGIDARGFLFGATVAHELGVGFVPVRKKGKLPCETVSHAYPLEYGEAEIEIHTDSFSEGERVALIDDLLATGGTARAAINLIEGVGAKVVQAQFLIELGFLGGRSLLAPTPVLSLLSFD